MSSLARTLRRPGQKRRSLRLFTGNLLGAFGAAAAAIQFVGPVFPAAFAEPGRWTLASLGPCVLWAAVRARPRSRIRHEFSYPDMAVVIEQGDLFARPEHLVVGFCDTFDTDTSAHGLVSAASVQGQLLERVYGGDVRKLDNALTTALRGVRPVRRERRGSKRAGKLLRYPMGTVAVLEDGSRLVFAVAYSELGNDGLSRSSVEALWLGLNRLWNAVYLHGQQGAVAIPLLGTGLARLDFLEAQDILRLVLLSFVARSREQRVCRELRVLIRPEDLDRIDLPDTAQFLRALGATAEH
jgi:hypothetical protein